MYNSFKNALKLKQNGPILFFKVSRCTGPALANIGLGEESKMASESYLKFHAKFENVVFKESAEGARKFYPYFEYFHD